MFHVPRGGSWHQVGTYRTQYSVPFWHLLLPLQCWCLLAASCVGATWLCELSPAAVGMLALRKHGVFPENAGLCVASLSKAGCKRMTKVAREGFAYTWALPNAQSRVWFQVKLRYFFRDLCLVHARRILKMSVVVSRRRSTDEHVSSLPIGQGVLPGCCKWLAR